MAPATLQAGAFEKLRALADRADRASASPEATACASRGNRRRARQQTGTCVAERQNRCWQTTDADISRTFSRHHVWKTCEQPFLHLGLVETRCSSLAAGMRTRSLGVRARWTTVLRQGSGHADDDGACP